MDIGSLFAPPRPPSPPSFGADRVSGGARLGERPDRDDRGVFELVVDEGALLGARLFGARSLARRAAAAIRRINALAARYDGRPAAELAEELKALRPRLRGEGLGGPATDQAFAALRALLDAELGLRPYDVQIGGGWRLLMGYLAEMRTGEGKTLTAVSPAAIAALAGAPVHVISVNPYLVRRDAEYARPVFERLGLSVGVAAEPMELAERRAVYGSDVVYAVNKQIVFDYLRDRIEARGVGSAMELSAASLADPAGAPRFAMRGLHFAIVDEADSILIDEARTPLIISRKQPNPDLALLAEAALELVSGFEEGRDYLLDARRRHIRLTEAGKKALKSAQVRHAMLLRGRGRREAAAILALYAQRLLHRGEHYVLQEGKVALVDEYTGRFMPDRSWGQGLQQIVERKEGLEPSDQTTTIGQLTFQRFFRRYRALAGMTGTAREVEGELWRVYGLSLSVVAPRFTWRLERLPTRILPSLAEKWEHVAARAGGLSRAGRAVLIGTRTIAASREASAALTKAGLAHRVLNAENDAEEAEIVAEAGQRDEAGAGRVTIATNMAGRGTDIRLAPEVRAAGGLAVILSERHDSGRIDRQLIGRAARQDDPGSAEIALSMEDDILATAHLGRSAARLARWMRSGAAPAVAQALARLLFDYAQRRLEHANSAARAASVERDAKLAKLLAFTGPPE